MNREEAIERLKALCESDYGCYIKAGWLGITNILAIEKVLEELDNKNKIIDSMADYMDIKSICVKSFKECQDIQDPHCKPCIIQYFEKKASDLNE